MGFWSTFIVGFMTCAAVGLFVLTWALDKGHLVIHDHRKHGRNR
jgi:hypothetical protein